MPNIDEQLEIAKDSLLFFGSQFIGDIKSYLGDAGVESLKSISGIDIDNRTGVVGFSPPNKSDPLEKNVLRYIEHIATHRTFQKSNATLILENDRGFRWNKLSPLALANIYFSAERYESIEKIYFSSEKDDTSEELRSLHYRALAKLGVYIWEIHETEIQSTSEKLEFHRYLWQKGDIWEAYQIGCKLSAEELNVAETLRFNNNQARVCRDLGELEAATNLISEMGKILSDPQNMELPALEHRHFRSSHLYNRAINAFITGNHRASISLTKASLNLRDRDYDKNYLELRMARSQILLGNGEVAISLIEAVEARKPDLWAKSLLESVKAEFHQFHEGNLLSAEQRWNNSIGLLEESHSLINYGKLGFCYLCIAKGDIELATSTIERAGSAAMVEIKIAREILRLVTTNRGSEVIDRYFSTIESSYSYDVNYCGFWIYGLMCADAYAIREGWPEFSPKKLRAYANDRQIDYEVIVNRLSKGKIKVPTVFISYCQADTSVDWVHDLANILRANGVTAEYDQSLRGKHKTIDFDDMMEEQILGSDFVVVILTPEYSSRVQKSETGVGIEYGLIKSDLLRKKFDRYIFLLHSGDYDSSSPQSIKSVDKYDFRGVDVAVPGQQIEDLLRHIHSVDRIHMQTIGTAPALTPRRP